ncbi:uncharacterized protein [Ptychodera flava]|uniref:uncharacterized protein n=1 Tax=Ptychodera flava TaxID=63121 RepID=UPI00396A8486
MDVGVVLSLYKNINFTFTNGGSLSPPSKTPAALAEQDVGPRDGRAMCFQECCHLWEEVRRTNQVHRLGDCFVKVTMELFHRLRNDKLTSKEKVTILNFLCESGALQMDVSVSCGGDRNPRNLSNTGGGSDETSPYHQKDYRSENEYEAGPDNMIEREMSSFPSSRTHSGVDMRTNESRHSPLESENVIEGDRFRRDTGREVGRFSKSYTPRGVPHSIEHGIQQTFRTIATGVTSEGGLHQSGYMMSTGEAACVQRCCNPQQGDNSSDENVSDRGMTFPGYQSPRWKSAHGEITQERRRLENDSSSEDLSEPCNSLPSLSHVTKTSNTSTSTGNSTHDTAARNSDMNFSQSSLVPQIESFWTLKGALMSGLTSCKDETARDYSQSCSQHEVVTTTSNPEGRCVFDIEHQKVEKSRESQTSLIMEYSTRNDNSRIGPEVSAGEINVEQNSLISCEYCDEYFLGRTSLTKHMKIHASEKEYNCNDVGKEYSRQKNLEIHQALQVPRGNRSQRKVNGGAKNQLTCKLCDKSFTRRDNLMRHILLHTGEKRYECRECGKRFAQKGNVKTHQRVHAKKRALQT